MRIFDDHQHRLLSSQSRELCRQGVQRSLPAVLWVQIQRRIVSIIRQRQHLGKECGVLRRSRSRREHGIELVEFRLRGVVMHKSGGTFHLADDGIKRAVGVLRRAEIAQACVRLSGDAFQQRRREPGLADPGLAGEEHHLAFTSLCPRPPPQQQFEFFFPPYQLRQIAASQWKALAVISQGCALALTGNASDAVQILTSGIAALRSTGATWGVSFYLSCLARAYADLGQFDDAWRCIGEAMTAVETTKEKWCEADIHRIAGEIVLLSPELNAAKAEAYFERALAVARKQQAKSWELRAAMSMARLLRDQGKWAEARDLLAPVYGWFTEGFDTLDLKEAKALLGELAKLH